MEESDLYICRSCWTIATPRTVSRGSTFMEILLWGLFLIPGIIYSTWRFTTRERVCPECSSLAMVPMNSVMGQRVLEKIYASSRTGRAAGSPDAQQGASFKLSNGKPKEVFRRREQYYGRRDLNFH